MTDPCEDVALKSEADLRFRTVRDRGSQSLSGTVIPFSEPTILQLSALLYTWAYCMSNKKHSSSLNRELKLFPARTCIGRKTGTPNGLRHLWPILYIPNVFLSLTHHPSCRILSL